MVILDPNATHFEVVYTFIPSAPRPNVSAVVFVLEIVQRLHWCDSHLENVQAFLVSFVHEILKLN